MKLNAQQRISLTLGSTLVDLEVLRDHHEVLRDQVAALTAKVAERDETIKKLQEIVTLQEFV